MDYEQMGQKWLNGGQVTSFNGKIFNTKQKDFFNSKDSIAELLFIVNKKVYFFLEFFVCFFVEFLTRIC